MAEPSRYERLTSEEPPAIAGLRRGVAIRPAEQSDLDRLHQLDRSVFGDGAYPLFALRQLMDVHGGYCLVADDGDQLVGYCLGAVGLRPPIGWLLGLGVLAQNRGSGHGRALARGIVGRIFAEGVRGIRTPVHPQNDAAIRIYETLGFRISGYHRDYFGPGDDRLMMWLDGREYRGGAYTDEH